METTKIISCPHCKKSTVFTNNPYRPFCSKRCKMIDLGQWADESYRVAGNSVNFENNEYNSELNNQPNIEEQDLET
ncbi:MAG: DNA gyrase inhibitor YacG [Deltaproteobacteria bacterium]|nr:DNA gyrase inhibitor YacG [Deltaproteobacteria bacterium]